MDSFSSVSFTHLFISWLLLLSPVYSKSIYSTSESYNAWTTTTVEETITVDCNQTATSSSTTFYSAIDISSYDVISGSSTTPSSLTATGTSLATRNTTPAIPSTSFATPDSSPATSSISLATNDTPFALPSTLPAILSTSCATSGTTVATLDTSLAILSALPAGPSKSPFTSGTLLATYSMSLVTTSMAQTEMVLPGATAVTIGGTLVSLGLSGTLVIGTDTLTLPHGSSAMEVFTIGSQTVTIRPTGFEVASPSHLQQSPTVTGEFILVPGGSPVTIGTVPLSLGPGGTLVIGGSTQVISATMIEIITVDGQTITASSGGFVVEQPTPKIPGLTTVTTGTAPFVFATSFISIPSLTTWSETTIELPGQKSPTILPIWPCLTLCTSSYNGVIIIPESPLPPSTVIIPPPFNFPPLTIGSDGLPTAVTSELPSLPRTLPTVLATTTADEVSSTMTTVPPGFSTEATANALWTMNTWITTDIGGNPTVVPVLVGCPGCGGVHGGIILWNLPQLQWVSFQLPGFPGLPKFHLPCIKIFGVRISGDCDNPPSTDGDNLNNPTTTPSPSSQGDSSALSTASFKLSLSSSSSCSNPTAVASCSQLCEVVTQSGGVVASSCASAVCQTITTCFATPTTSISYSDTTESAWICAPTCSACQGGSFPSASSGLPSSTPHGLVKRILELPPNPNDQYSRYTWMARTVDNVHQLTVDDNGLGIGLSSSEIIPLSGIDGLAGTKGYQTGISGLHGCAFVLVATPEAIYMAHIWEGSFVEAKFQADALNFLATGAPDRGRVGLDPYTKPVIKPRYYLAPGKSPLVLVVAARDRNNPTVDAEAKPELFKLLRAALQTRFPFSTIIQHNYVPAINEDQFLVQPELGKVLVQYEPAQPACDGTLRPTIRVWAQGEVLGDATFFRYPSQGQATTTTSTTSHGQALAIRRGTFNSVCALPWSQSVIPYEISATYGEFSIYNGPSTLLTTNNPYSISTPTQAASSASLTSTLQTSFSSIAIINPVLCIPFQDPHAIGNGNSYCQCSFGTLTTTLQMMTLTNNPCGYTTLPSQALTSAPPSPLTSVPSNPFPYTFTYDLGGVVACNSLSYLNVNGNAISYCAGDKTTISTAPPPPPATTTSAAPTKPITCRFCDAGFGWDFVISGSGAGNGLPDLKHELDGCGTLTGWDVQGVNVQFYLDFFIKSGCVERAIQSAGGPSISCHPSGLCG